MLSLQKDVKDVFAGIMFEVAYSLGKHVLAGHQERDLPALTPVLRWRKGQRIAVRNEVTPISLKMIFETSKCFIVIKGQREITTEAFRQYILLLQNQDVKSNIQMILISLINFYQAAK